MPCSGIVTFLTAGNAVFWIVWLFWMESASLLLSWLRAYVADLYICWQQCVSTHDIARLSTPTMIFSISFILITLVSSGRKRDHSSMILRRTKMVAHQHTFTVSNLGLPVVRKQDHLAVPTWYVSSCTQISYRWLIEFYYHAPPLHQQPTNHLERG